MVDIGARIGERIARLEDISFLEPGGVMSVLNLWIGSFKEGVVLIATSGIAVRAVLLGEDRGSVLGDFEARFPGVASAEEVEPSALVLSALAAFSGGACPELQVDGTPFQRTVWTALRTIPRGATASYGEIARIIGRPKSFRAVAQACGANPIAILVPCHRVVGSDGAIGGYRWGLAHKRRLLAMEAA